MSDPTPRDEPASSEPPSTLPSETIDLEIAALEALLPPAAREHGEGRVHDGKIRSTPRTGA